MIPILTVLSAAVSYDLTTLETVKDELEIDDADTSSDSWLNRAVTQVSKAIARDCKRVFAPELVQDQFEVRQFPYRYKHAVGADRLQLSRWPILAVVSVVQTEPAPLTTQTLLAGVDFLVDTALGQLMRIDSDTGLAMAWEAVPTSVIYTGGFGAAVSETHTVPATPYQVTVSQSGVFSCDQSVSYASGTALVSVAVDPAQGQYSQAASVYTFNSADAGQVLTFDYATFAPPDDLEEVVLRLVTGRYRDRGRNPALIQRDQPGVGTERYWFGGVPGQTGAFAPDIEAALDGYRVPVLG